MCEPRFPKEKYPHDSFRTYPNDFQSAHIFLAERCPTVNAHCPIPDCPGAKLDPIYEKRRDRKYAYNVRCRHCSASLKYKPSLYDDLEAELHDLVMATSCLIERHFDESIYRECPSIGSKTLLNLKKRMEAHIIVAEDEIEEPIVLGGNNWRNIVQPDERTKGRRKKGSSGHQSIMRGNYWSACGPHHKTGKDIWVSEPFWQFEDIDGKIGCREGPMNDRELFPFFDKYFAPRTFFSGDGLTSMANYVKKNPEKNDFIKQIPHEKGKYVRKERVILPDGTDLGEIKISTQRVDGRHAHHRRFEANDGNVPQSRMKGRTHFYTWLYNYRENNLHRLFFFYTSLKLSKKEVDAALAWDYGTPKYRKKRKYKTRGSDGTPKRVKRPGKKTVLFDETTGEVKMRTCGQCGDKFVDCLARREEHYKYECAEGRSAWNAARIAEGRATKKKEIHAVNRPFKICIACKDGMQAKYCVPINNWARHKKNHEDGKIKHPKTGAVVIFHS